VHASEQERPDVKRQREDWEHCLPGLDLDRLVFLDECGVNTLIAGNGTNFCDRIFNASASTTIGF